jgi:hypothetical protein
VAFPACGACLRQTLYWKRRMLLRRDRHPSRKDRWFEFRCLPKVNLPRALLPVRSFTSSLIVRR